MLTARTKIRLVSKLLVLGILVAAAAFVALQDRKAYARVCHEVEHYYYSDATYTTQVGQKWLYCNGTYTWGQVTQYVFTVDGEPCCGNCPSWCAAE